MLMPVTVPKKDKLTVRRLTASSQNSLCLRDYWFTVHQTEGDDFKEETIIPEWDKQKALDKLLIKENAYESVDGNVQGYASFHSFAINPLAIIPT
jgi:hypothetical protein